MKYTNSDIYSAIFHNLNNVESLNWFYISAILNKFSIAVWRLPNRCEQQAIVDLSETSKKINIDLNKIKPGFIISTFDNRTQKGLDLLIQAHLHLKNSICSDYSANDEFYANSIQENKKRFENTLKDLFKTANNKTNGKILTEACAWFNAQPEIAIPVVTKEDYCRWVERGLQTIKNSEFEKVVLSRAIMINLKSDFNPFILFQRLCAAYPTAFVSLVAIPQVGTWIGATPELLLSLDNNKLTTVSLAGTRSVDAELENKWRDKELDEQAIVSEYIKECFFRQNIHGFTEQGPITVKIGNLLHLQTKFSLDLTSPDSKIDVNQFLKDLHPTPAVCGVPKREALHFIQANETHDRAFYSGFLGPVKVDDQSQLFVNLRCLQLQKSSAILYAGSGITIDSIPEQECIETELKLKALLNFLNNTPSDQDINKLKSSEYSVTDKVLCNDSV